MLRAGIVVLLVLTGCNQILGLDRTRAIDAGLPVDSGPSADVLPATCNVTSALESFASTYLADNTSHGKDTELITNSAQPALFTFGIDGLIPPNQHIAAAILKVAPITKCGKSACTPCPTGASTYQIYWSFENWVEGQETSTKSGNGAQWAAPFAEGAADRSELIVDAPLPTGAQLELVVPMTDVARVPAEPWIGTHSATPFTRISVQLRTNDWAAFASDDHDESLCGEAAAPPSLILTVCE